MEKPGKITMICYNWHEAVRYIEERYGCDLNKKSVYDTYHRGGEEGDYYDYLCSEYWDNTPEDDYIFIDHVLLKKTSFSRTSIFFCKAAVFFLARTCSIHCLFPGKRQMTGPCCSIYAAYPSTKSPCRIASVC